MSLNDISGLIEDPQRERLRQIIQNRFADDRDQDECRYLMRFWWQLRMSYTEVTLEQLREHVHEPKLTAIEDLIDAIRTRPQDIKAWIGEAEVRFPVVMDRGMREHLGIHGDGEG